MFIFLRVARKEKSAVERLDKGVIFDQLLVPPTKCHEKSIMKTSGRSHFGIISVKSNCLDYSVCDEPWCSPRQHVLYPLGGVCGERWEVGSARQRL